jgi:hypothetical protein
LGKCGQQVNIRRIIRDIYLFEVELKLLFSSLLERRNGAFWAVLIQFVKDDDDIGRVSGSKFEPSGERYFQIYFTKLR